MFHDIFSKIKEKEEIKLNIIIDYREKNSLVPSELVKLNTDIEFKQLPVGDYLINNIVIERKTVNDLKASIIDKRIFTQIRELKQYPSYFLIIEGNRENLYNEILISRKAMIGFIISIQKEFNIPILFTNNEKETAEHIIAISKNKTKKDISINPKKISYNLEEQKQYILESFPNIGPVKAKRLIEKFGSLKNIFNAKEEELKKIIGNNTSNFLRLTN